VKEREKTGEKDEWIGVCDVIGPKGRKK